MGRRGDEDALAAGVTIEVRSYLLTGRHGMGDDGVARMGVGMGTETVCY
jgi:hypothetical protein